MKILLSSNKKILSKYLKEHSKIGFIPTASEIDDDRWYMEKDRDDLMNNYDLVIIDVTNETKEEILNKFKKVDAIFVAGGNAFYLLQQLRLKDVVSELIDFANEKIYIGSSAGSCIASPNIDYLGNLDDKNDAPLLKDYEALNLINGYILPHYKSSEKYTKLIDDTIKQYKDLNFIVLTNSDAVIVNDRNNYEIVTTD